MQTLSERAQELIHSKDKPASTIHGQLADLYARQIGELLNPIPRKAVGAIIVALECYARELREACPIEGALVADCIESISDQTAILAMEVKQ